MGETALTNTVIVYQDEWGRPDARELTDDEEDFLDRAFNYFWGDEYIFEEDQYIVSADPFWVNYFLRNYC